MCSSTSSYFTVPGHIGLFMSKNNYQNKLDSNMTFLSTLKFAIPKKNYPTSFPSCQISAHSNLQTSENDIHLQFAALEKCFCVGVKTYLKEKQPFLWVAPTFSISKMSKKFELKDKSHRFLVVWQKIKYLLD